MSRHALKPKWLSGRSRFAKFFVVEDTGAPALHAHPLRLKTAPPPRKWGIRPPVSLRDERTGCKPTSAMLTAETGLWAPF